MCFTRYPSTGHSGVYGDYLPNAQGEDVVDAGRSPACTSGCAGSTGGDPESIRFFHDAGLDYVSCSPFRVPIARLEAGRAAATAGADATA